MTDRLGPYELIRLIGRGGMGEVHLARDTRLDRDVALKLLPDELARDEERRGRFLREARAAATLNHPNVTTIHEVGEAEGRDYIAQEYLEGRPLSEIIAERKLPLAELAEIAVPLAEALEYAHERGVIHRDLKPANVMVTDRGHAKLLDFGLAKVLYEQDDKSNPGAPSTTLTISGAVFGTPSAMSPEQALGKTVDARSDVFSFGALLYEMATGKPAFLGTTVQETLDKVLHSEPEPLARLRRDLPSDVSNIVGKALRKDPTERYQSMAEVAADLRHFKRSTDSGVVPLATSAPAAGSTQRALRTFGLPVALLIIVALSWQLFLKNERGAGSTVRLTNPKQLTSAVGLEAAPGWAPSGDVVVYHGRASASEPFDIWIMQPGSGTPVARTADLEGDAMFPSVSPDGKTIAFWLKGSSNQIWGLVEKRGLYTMPVLGGVARPVLRDVLSYGPPQWSADGEQIAFPHKEDNTSMIRIVTASGEWVRDVPVPVARLRHRAELSWSPDNRLFAFVDTADPTTSDTNRLWVLCEETGEAFPMTDGRTLARSPRWSPDGTHLYYASNQGGARDLWEQAVDPSGEAVGEPTVLTAGLSISAIAFSRDGRRLVYASGGPVFNLWSVPLLEDRPATWTDAQQITYDEAVLEYADVSPDGEWLAVASDRAGNDDLWLMPSGGGAMRALTSNPTPDWYPRWSPDGSQLLFYSYRTGNRDLWVMPSDGGQARQLTTDPATDWFGEWAPSGRRIAWGSARTGPVWLYHSSLDDWDPQPISPGSLGFEAQSTTSVWITDESIFGVWGQTYALIDIDGTVLRRYESEYPVSNAYRRLPGERTVLYDTLGNIVALDLDTGDERFVTDLRGRPGILGNVMCTDGERLWFTWTTWRGDLWMMDVERGGG